MEKESNRDISSRHKRRISTRKNEKRLFVARIVKWCDWFWTIERIKECQIENKNNQYIENEDESMDNELLRNFRNWSFKFKIRHNVINAFMEILRYAPKVLYKLYIN